MTVNHKDYGDQTFDAQPFLVFDRPFKCTILCCNRPEISVNLVENGSNVYLGKVKNPFAFCDLIGEIYDAANNKKYTIEGSCCQCGVLCEGPCCQKASLAIKKEGQVCGSLDRVQGSVVQNCFTTVCNFAVTFPPDSSPEDRALFLAATIMIDFAYFEKKQQGGAINGGVQITI